MASTFDCSTCGAPLRILSEYEPAPADARHGANAGVVRLGSICSNLDCPTVDSDLAKPAKQA